MSDFRASLRSLHNRVMLTVARCVVSLVNDGTKMQTLQVELLKREIRDNIERVQNYGFTSHPHPGAEGVVVFVGGNRDLGLCVAVDDRRYRLVGLQQGEVAIYTDEGDNIVLKRGNVIEVNTTTFRVNASELCEFNTPLATFSGDVQADADILDNANSGGRSMSGMREVYNGHTHSDPQGGNVSTPNQDM